MRSTFNILFYVNKSKVKNGVVPVMGRVTINGTQSQFSCKKTIPLDMWDVKGNCAKGRSKEALQINRELDNIKAQIIKHYQHLSDREAFVTAEMVRRSALGTVALHVPHIKRDGLLATELALSAVNRHTSHHRHHTVLHLTLVHVEQNVESTSHVSYSFFNFGCKNTISFGIHRYAKCSSLRNKNGLRFGNLTPSPILHILRYPLFCPSSFFPVLPLFAVELR